MSLIWIPTAVLLVSWTLLCRQSVKEVGVLSLFFALLFKQHLQKNAVNVIERPFFMNPSFSTQLTDV